MPCRGKALPPEMKVMGGHRDKRPYLSEVGVDFMIEDDPEYLGYYIEMGVRVGIMLRPWNRACPIPSARTFGSWPDLQKWFLETNGHRSGQDCVTS